MTDEKTPTPGAETALATTTRETKVAKHKAEVEKLSKQLAEAKAQLAHSEDEEDEAAAGQGAAKDPSMKDTATEGGPPKKRDDDLGRLVLEKMGETFIDLANRPIALDLARIKATMHQQTVQWQTEMTRLQAELERDRRKAEQTSHARGLLFACFALLVGTLAVLDLVRLNQKQEAGMIILAFSIFAGVLLGRRLDGGIVEAVLRALRRDQGLLPPREDSLREDSLREDNRPKS